MTGAFIGACVALVVAVVSQLAAMRRVRDDRRYERRRIALLDVQDAALALRRELRSYGRRLREDVSAGQLVAPRLPDAAGPVLVIGTSADAVDEAQGRLDVCVVRLEQRPPSAAVGKAVIAWETSAREHFLSPSDETAGAEVEQWQQLNLAAAAALNS